MAKKQPEIELPYEIITFDKFEMIFESLEEVLSSGNTTFLDTNMFIPAYYFPKLVNESFHESFMQFKYKTFIEYLFEIGKNPRYYPIKHKEIQKIKRTAIDFQKSFSKRLEGILDKYENATTIERVLLELDKSRKYFSDNSRVSKPAYKGEKKYKGQNKNPHQTKKQYNDILFDCFRSVSKGDAKVVDRALDKLKDKGVFNEKDLESEKQKLYLFIFEFIKQYSIQNKIHMNSLRTDQHLLATAFYLSSIEGKPTCVFTLDRRDFHRLYNCTQDLKERLKTYKGLIKEPEVRIDITGFFNFKKDFYK